MVISRWPRARQSRGPRAHAPNKTRGKPAGQDTSSYTSTRLVLSCIVVYLAVYFAGLGKKKSSLKCELICKMCKPFM